MNKNFGKIVPTGSVEYAPNPAVIITHHHSEWDEPVINPETGEPTGETEHKTHDWEYRNTIVNPTAEQYLRAEDGPYYPIVSNAPEHREGFVPVRGKHILVGDHIETEWTYRPIAVTVEDYDAAMEEHITQTRIARGYTTREPSAYVNSPNVRYAQDAADWALFLASVMDYGLAVMNEYRKTGAAPSMEEFKAGLPTIEWTFSEEV